MRIYVSFPPPPHFPSSSSSPPAPLLSRPTPTPPSSSHLLPPPPHLPPTILHDSWTRYHDKRFTSLQQTVNLETWEHIRAAAFPALEPWFVVPADLKEYIGRSALWTPPYEDVWCPTNWNAPFWRGTKSSGEKDGPRREENDHVVDGWGGADEVERNTCVLDAVGRWRTARDDRNQRPQRPLLPPNLRPRKWPRHTPFSRAREVDSYFAVSGEDTVPSEMTTLRFAILPESGYVNMRKMQDLLGEFSPPPRGAEGLVPWLDPRRAKSMLTYVKAGTSCFGRPWQFCDRNFTETIARRYLVQLSPAFVLKTWRPRSGSGDTLIGLYHGCLRNWFFASQFLFGYGSCHDETGDSCGESRWRTGSICRLVSSRQMNDATWSVCLRSVLVFLM